MTAGSLISSAMDQRRAIIASIFDASGFGLEVGPSHSPVFPKSMGYNVESLDYADADGLKAKYAGTGLDISRIETVDYVSDGRPLHEVILDRGRYDFIFSSHVIEHITDIAGFFRSSEMLLRPGGVLVFAVPDKRYSFDALQMPSTTGDVVQAFIEGRTRHAPSRIFDFFATTAYLDAKRPTWSIDAIGSVELMGTPQNAKLLLDKALEDTGVYTDIHGWYFTPASFRLIMNDLFDIGLIELREAAIMSHGNFEFYTAYSKDAAGPCKSRAELILDMIQEQTESGQKILAGAATRQPGVAPPTVTAAT